MPPFFKTIVILTWLLIVFSAGQSQKLNFQFTQFNTENGLANNTVTDIIQDKKGFLWFATGNGLQRFDGLRFSTWRYELNNRRSLPSDLVAKLLEDDQENIWIVCHNGIARINKFRQAPQRIPLDWNEEGGSFQPTQFFQDSKKNIWLVTRPYGIFWYDPKAQRFVPGNKKLPLTHWKSFSMAEEAGTGNFWVGGDSGLAYIDIGRNQFYHYLNNPRNIAILADPRFYHTAVNGMKLDNLGRLWLNTFTSDYPRSTKINYGSYYYNLSSGQVTSFTPPRLSNYNYAIDDENNLWLLGEDIFSLKVGEKFITIPIDREDAFGLKAHIVYAFKEDRDHNRWLGTSEGVFVFNPEENRLGRGVPFDENKQRIEATPLQFLELPGGRVWVATWGGGIMEYDLNFNPIRRYYFGSGPEDVNFNMTWSMTRATDGRIWIGCQAGRIMIFDPKTNRFEKLAPPEFDLRTIRTIAEDGHGNIWFGARHGLLVKYDKQTNRFIRYAHSTYPVKDIYGQFNKLMADGGNIMWACTNSAGLLKINTTTGQVIETFKHSESNPASIASNSTNNIIKYNDTLYIVSSLMGINLFNVKTKKFSHITTRDGLPTNNVLSLRKDAFNNVWAGLDGYLVKLSLPGQNVVVMGRKDGVFNEIFQANAMELLSDGKIVAGTTDDFLYFQPKNFRSSAAPPDVQITGFKVFSRDVNFDSILSNRNKIKLPFNENFIRIEYSPLGFLNDNLTYYYKLEGLDKEWVRGTADLSANYANLGPGTYNFQVKCENGDGISSRKITSLSFIIRPPFWETWWFIVLLAAGLAWILYFIHRVRVNRIITMEKVRSRIARDLHDDMGSTLSTINILSEMAKMKIEKDTNVTKTYIAKISDNSSRMMEAMDDIVWSINPMNDNMQKITARMREYATNLLEAKEIEYSFEVDEAVKHVKLDMEARRDFFLIFKEAINNLAKYSGCTYAQIKIEVYEYTLVMKIQDNGKGFVVKDADGGNGLTNMQKRAQNLNAKIEIESHVGVGTKILLEVNFA